MHVNSLKIHHSLNFIRWRFTTSKNWLGEDSSFPKFIHLEIRRRNSVESLTTLEEGEFKFAIDGCIRVKEWFEPIVLQKKKKKKTSTDVRCF